LGKKDVYVKDWEFGKLLKLLADKGNKDADTMYKRHMKGKKAVGFLQKANPFF
jgi:hypothetical protein